MRPLKFLCCIALLLAPGACRREPTAPGDDASREVVSGSVAVSREVGGVRLTNGTGQPVAYAVWNAGWLALFGPCTSDGPDCPRLLPGASIVIRDAAIGGHVPEMREVVVRWWHVVADGVGGRRAGEVQEIFLHL